LVFESGTAGASEFKSVLAALILRVKEWNKTTPKRRRGFARPPIKGIAPGNTISLSFMSAGWAYEER
jgi:hypothetical protein